MGLTTMAAFPALQFQLTGLQRPCLDMFSPVSPLLLKQRVCQKQYTSYWGLPQSCGTPSPHTHVCDLEGVRGESSKTFSASARGGSWNS